MGEGNKPSKIRVAEGGMTGGIPRGPYCKGSEVGRLANKTEKINPQANRQHTSSHVTEGKECKQIKRNSREDMSGSNERRNHG